MTRTLRKCLTLVLLTAGCSNAVPPPPSEPPNPATAKTATTKIPSDDVATVFAPSPSPGDTKVIAATPTPADTTVIAPSPRPAESKLIGPKPSPAAAIQASAITEEKPKPAAAQFDAALIRLTENQQPDAPFALPPDERNLVSSVVDAISAFRQTLADPNAMMSTKTAPLTALSDQFRAQAPLAIPTLAVCRSVTQFGVYDPYEPARFTAGKETPVIIYCELDNFRSGSTADNRWETKLTYEAVLFTESDTAVSVLSKKPTNIQDLCRNRRHDFFLADRMTVPGTLPVGKYILKVTVVDQLANHVAEQSVPIIVATN